MIPTKEDTTCKGCKWTGKSLRTHLIRTKSPCKDLYDMEALKRESNEMNKAKDAKRKYQRYHSTPEEGQKKKAYMRKYRREHQEEISMAKKEYYEQKTTQLKIESNPENRTSDNSRDKTKMTRTEDERDINDYKCPICEKSFVLPRVKERHMHHFHSKASNRIACDICEKAFEYKDNLSRHMREFHGGNRHKCEVCPATFTRSSYLQSHKDNEKHYLAFYCCICYKELAFKHLAGLINHVVVKQNVVEEPCTDEDGQFTGGTKKWLNSGILLTCKSRFETILVEKGENIYGTEKPLQLEGFKKRMRKKEDIINYGLREAHGSQEKLSVKLEFIPETTHYQIEGKSCCKYCGMHSPFKNQYCLYRDKEQTRMETSWTIENRTDN